MVRIDWISALLTLALFGAATYASLSLLILEERSTQEKSLNFDNQLKVLDGFEKDLKDLVEFINNQKQQVRLYEKEMEYYRKENEIYKNVVNISREQYEAMNFLQSRENEKRFWVGMVFSFVLGIFSSMTATILFNFIRRDFQ